MKCPKCESSDLEASLVRGVEVDQCLSCRGIWFDESELQALTGLTNQELRSLQSLKTDEILNRKKGDCPRDSNELLRVISPKDESVVIDTCPTCKGIWLDDGELAKVVKS